MIDMDAVTVAARVTVEERRKAALEAEIAEESANAAHRASLVATGQQMATSLARAKAARAERHAEARSTARVALDSLRELTAVRERCESKVGFSKADLMEAEKAAQRCTAPSPDEYPTESELDAWRQRHGQLAEQVRRLHARISVESGELDRARNKELDALADFQRCERIEAEARAAL